MAKKRESAGARIKRQGRSLVWVTLSGEDKPIVRAAAGYAGVPMSRFLELHGVTAAKKILEKIKKSE